MRPVPAGTNLAALFSRLSSTCSSRSGSQATGARGTARSASATTPRSRSTGPMRSKAFSTSSRRSQRRTCHSMRPASRRERSRMSSTRRESRSASSAITATKRCRSSSGRSGWSRRISAKERIAVSGVRSSWLTVARNSSLSRSSSRSRSLAARSSAATRSSSRDFSSSRWAYSIARLVSSRTASSVRGSSTSPRTMEASTRRAEVAPMARASSRSACSTSSGSAASAGPISRPRIRPIRARKAVARAGPRKRTSSSWRAATRISPRKARTVGAPRWTSTKKKACTRSRGVGSLTSERVTRTARLAPSDQITAWVTGSRPSRPKSARGRSRPIPKGPSCSSAAESQPASASSGTTRVHVHSPMPARMPPSAPARRASCQ
ncbi:hypothetical protein HRbin39_00267 [bacterium HR39]|nr:hypothetical protein HRbin39_00267 [bacterium HR39]